MKRLLIVTQAVDEDNPVLGFFVNWIRQFAERFEKVTVVCLEKGEYDLLEKVRVFSLGKEKYNLKNSNTRYSWKIGARFMYIWNFYRYIWRERKNYDCVFVHMNQEYVLLGGLFWKIWGKMVGMWRNHPEGSWLTRLTVWMCDGVFCTSKYSWTARFRKTKLMPVGIDIEKFKIHKYKRIKNSVLFLGRISPIKRQDVFIEILFELKNRGFDFRAVIVGEPLPKDEKFYKNLRDKVSDYELEDRVKFLGAVRNNEVARLYNYYEVALNLTEKGSMDKTIFESMACGCLAVFLNKNLVLDWSDFYLEEVQLIKLADKIQEIFRLSDLEKEEIGGKMREYVLKNHSLELLIEELLVFYK